MKWPEAQKQRPHELLWMLWFDKKVHLTYTDLAKILEKVVNNEKAALPLRGKINLCFFKSSFNRPLEYLEIKDEIEYS